MTSSNFKRGMMKTAYKLSVAFFVLAIVFLIPYVLAVEPFGATVVEGDSVTAPADSAYGVNATAGNITELTVSGFTTTQSWQGYFGNVTGVIQLANAADEVLYNWSLASPEGEIYASPNQSLQWSTIQCFNFTATGELDSSGETGGLTNNKGMNLTQIETKFNITWDDVDGVNETFSDGSSHNEFFTANLNFTVGECLETLLYDDTGAGTDNNFEQVLLYEPASESIVFATILDEDEQGFDDDYHDFQMIVLDDGHGTDTSATTYYFFVELE
jgi:hypothetical protein